MPSTIAENEKFLYDFRKDEAMQGLGNSLFPGNERIALSVGSNKKRIISLLIYEDHITNPTTIVKHVNNFKIYYFTELDPCDDYFNLYVLIEKRNARDNTYYTIRVPGNRPDEQFNLIDFLLARHNTEIWITNFDKTFVGVKAPVLEDIESTEFFKDLKEANRDELNQCAECGRYFKDLTAPIYCPDCISKALVEHNRRG